MSDSVPKPASSLERFLLCYPQVFHVTLAPDPEAMIHSGLRSTSGLLDLIVARPLPMAHAVEATKSLG